MPESTSADGQFLSRRARREAERVAREARQSSIADQDSADPAADPATESTTEAEQTGGSDNSPIADRPAEPAEPASETMEQATSAEHGPVRPHGVHTAPVHAVQPETDHDLDEDDDDANQFGRVAPRRAAARPNRHGEWTGQSSAATGAPAAPAHAPGTPPAPAHSPFEAPGRPEGPAAKDPWKRPRRRSTWIDDGQHEVDMAADGEASDVETAQAEPAEAPATMSATELADEPTFSSRAALKRYLRDHGLDTPSEEATAEEARDSVDDSSAVAAEHGDAATVTGTSTADEPAVTESSAKAAARESEPADQSIPVVAPAAGEASADADAQAAAPAGKGAKQAGKKTGGKKSGGKKKGANKQGANKQGSGKPGLNEQADKPAAHESADSETLSPKPATSDEPGTDALANEPADSRPAVVGSTDDAAADSADKAVTDVPVADEKGADEPSADTSGADEKGADDPTPDEKGADEPTADTPADTTGDRQVPLPPGATRFPASAWATATKTDWRRGEAHRHSAADGSAQDKPRRMPVIKPPATASVSVVTGAMPLSEAGTTGSLRPVNAPLAGRQGSAPRGTDFDDGSEVENPPAPPLRASRGVNADEPALGHRGPSSTLLIVLGAIVVVGLALAVIGLLMVRG